MKGVFRKHFILVICCVYWVLFYICTRIIALISVKVGLTNFLQTSTIGSFLLGNIISLKWPMLIVTVAYVILMVLLRPKQLVVAQATVPQQNIQNSVPQNTTVTSEQSDSVNDTNNAVDIVTDLNIF